MSANLDFRSTKKKKQSKQIECVFNSYTILMPPIFYHLKTRYFVKNHWLSEKKDIFLRNHPTFTHIQFGFNQISTFWDELLFFICPAAMVILDFRWTKTKLFNRVKYGTFLQNKGAVKSDSTHDFFGNACTKSGPLRFSQFSSCWLILSVCWPMSFAFPFGRFLGVR